MNHSTRTDSAVIRHATKLAVATITLLMALAAFLLWWQSKESQRASDMVAHTYDVRGHIRMLMSNVKDAQLGQRGFLLTGNSSHLDPYLEAMRDGVEPDVPAAGIQPPRSIMQEIAYLKKLTSDNPIQQANMSEMEIEVLNLVEYLTASIEQRKVSPAARIDHDRGKMLMERVRNMARILEAEETHLLAMRMQLDRANMRHNQNMMVGAMLVFYALLTSAIVMYQRNRARATEQLRQYNHELEKREEELKMQQEELKASNEEIEASNEELEEKTNALEEQNARIRKQSQELEETRRLMQEKAEELEQSSKYKSEFLANMSHELRTPLNSLLILARSLAMNENGNLIDEQVEEAQVIYNGGLELLALINDILDLSKVEAGKISILTENISLEGMTKRIRQQFSPIAKDKGVAFHVTLDDTLPEKLYTDGQRVEQIAKNLLSNAFKFTEKGSVTLEIRTVKDEEELKRVSLAKPVIAFSVIDTGIGIEPSKFKDIFEAFQQEDGSTDRHYGGTGLGLTIARKFAHMLGGEIHVMSVKGQGSNFTLYLPLVAAVKQDDEAPSRPQVAAPLEHKPAASAVRMLVPDDRTSIGPDDKVLLIVEDDRDFAMILLRTGRKRGYKCLIAGDGKSGLLLASEYSVTAVILDLRLPDMNGMHVLDQLKDNLKTRHIPVHIITALEDSGIAPLKKGAIGYLTKPMQQEDIDAVFAKIEGLLQSEVKKVLVVEDDRKTQVAIQSLLKQKHIELTTASNGNAALSHVKSGMFDCVILDLKLPDMTGFEWLQKVEAELGDGRTPPIIIYTARDLSEDENRQLAHYTNSIVIKGVSSSERLLDEVTLFLHSVESNLSKDQQDIIRMQHHPDRALQNRTVLLVDDDMRNTFALSKMLKKHGMQVIIADNGQMALDMLKEKKEIELVIMDIMMPVMDGYEAMRAIRAYKPWQDLPVIALTARAMPEEQERCIEAGANDYLTKPVDLDRLLTLLRVWLFRQEKVA